MRLMALLQELVREKGYKGAARVLEVEPADGDREREDGEGCPVGCATRWSGRCRRASAPAAERQRRRNEQVEGRVEKLEGEVETLGKEVRRRLSAVEGGGSGLAS